MMYNKEKVNILKQRYSEGTRICLERMGDDPRPIPPGTNGTVRFIDDCGTIHCSFDNGRMFGVIPEEDSFHIIQQEEVQEEENEMNMTM